MGSHGLPWALVEKIFLMISKGFHIFVVVFEFICPRPVSI